MFLPNPAVGSSKRALMSVDSPDASLGDTLACHLKKAAALTAAGAQSQRNDPESRGNFLAVILSALLISCPTEWDSTGENSSCPGIIDFSEPQGFSKRHIFRLISFPAFASAVWKDRRMLSILCPGGLGEAMPAKLMSISLAGPRWREDLGVHWCQMGPCTAEGGISFFWLLTLDEGKETIRKELAKVRVCRREKASLPALSSVQQGSCGRGSQLSIRLGSHLGRGSRRDHWTTHAIRRQPSPESWAVPASPLCHLQNLGHSHPLGPSVLICRKNH